MAEGVAPRSRGVPGAIPRLILGRHPDLPRCREREREQQPAEIARINGLDILASDLRRPAPPEKCELLCRRSLAGMFPARLPIVGKSWLSVNLTVAARLMHVSAPGARRGGEKCELM